MPDEDIYQGLLEKLAADKNWPQVYLFKFIVPNDNKTVALTQALFGQQAQVTMTKSRTGIYVSVSAKEMMLSSDEVINIYKKSSKIKGLIAL
jgi:hypothetical protein